jgi:transcriptional regulator with XRE-family HTH domain
MIGTKGGANMNQQKTGEFLKHLRKEKGLTQEQLAGQFYVSSRTVSRWETGSNMPDLDLLIELADFYDVDIREIIDGERKSENMDNETKDTLKKVAEYAAEENKKLKNKMIDMMLGAVILLVFSSVLFENTQSGLLYGIVPESACNNIMMFSQGLAVAALVLNILHLWGVFDKIHEWKMNRKRNPR